MRVGLAQVDTRVGDLDANADIVCGAVAAAGDCDLVVLPELVLTGYPPRDLLFDDGFVDAVANTVEDVARALASGPPVLLGAPIRSGSRTPGHPGLYDAALLLRGGRVVGWRAKRLLPAYDVFHEPRWFVPGSGSEPLEGVGVLICEDLWDEGYPVHPPAELRASGAGVLVCLSGSPYRHGVHSERVRHARRAGGPLVYVNAVGAHDELVFDGRSFVLGAAGDVLAELPAFREDVRVVDLDAGPVAPEAASDLLFEALVCGVRGFCRKNGVRTVHLGLSGGVDSAVVACVAAAAVGPANVRAIAMPSRYTDPRSTSVAAELADGLGIHLDVVSIEAMHAAVEGVLRPTGVGAENVQARLRMLVLTEALNRHGGVLLNTSNKTELSLGYGTLYGDLAGSLSPIGDLTKPEVQALARRLPIPAFIVERPPTAELRPDQVDPFDYAVVGPAVEADIQAGRGDRRVRAAEHKRWQHGIVLKVSDKAFGTGRMIPVTRG